MLVAKNKELCLSVFMFLCFICHGMFFAREWLLLGSLLIIYSLIYICQTNNFTSFKAKVPYIWSYQTFFFLALIVLSLAGLLNPVRKIEGWLEAYKWLIFMIAFLWGRSLTETLSAEKNILDKIITVALFCTLIIWIPGSEFIWLPAGLSEEGRFAFSFGYPNAAAALFGALLIILQKNKKLNIFYTAVFLLALLATGSRAAVFLFVICFLLVVGKKLWLNVKENKSYLRIAEVSPTKECSTDENTALLFYRQAVWQGLSPQSIFLSKVCLSILIVVLFLNVMQDFPASLQHLLNWTETTLPERFVYYIDSLKLALYGNFLPQAGGWLGFPFVQTISYWTLDPHSSFCRILLNQGLPGVLILSWWALKGMAQYISDFLRSKDLKVVCSKTAALYLGLHSLVDVDMAFGALGIFFWLLIGLNSK